MIKRIIFLLLIYLCSLTAIAEENITRQEISLMHKMGIRMALEGDKPYIIPDDINPTDLINTELLDLSNQQIPNLPDWLKKFKNLRKLDLSNSGIYIENAIGFIEINKIGDKLEILNLSNGKFKNDEKVKFNFKNLRELNISGANGEIDNYEDLGYGLKNLIKLDLSENNLDWGLFTNNYGRIFRDFENLKELNLSNSEISLGILKASDLPQSLEALDISGNSGSQLHESFGDLFTLPALVQLKVDDNIQIPDSLLKKLKMNH